MKDIMKFYKKFNEIQIVKSIEGHNILVGCFFTMALMLNILPANEGKKYVIFLIIALLRLIDIHIHNVNVAFFDKINEKGKIIENISSYKRMFILNIMVCLEIVLLVKIFTDLFIFGIIALFPTVYIIGHCINYWIVKELINEKRVGEKK